MVSARIRLVSFFTIAAAGIVSLSIALFLLLPKRYGVQGWEMRTVPVATTGTTDTSLQEMFSPATATAGYGAADYEALARYVFEGWAAYRTPASERAHYPGAPSEAGRATDGLEGFARVFPLVAAWLASGRTATFEWGNSAVDLADVFARGLSIGTDPASPAYWGAIGDYSQALVESADVALGLWLSREQILVRLTTEERERVITWLAGALTSQAYDGNWQLFPLVVHRALKSLGVDVGRYDERMQSSWEFFKTFHRGTGWFFDPPHGFDYYNAWSIHYAMFWLQRMDPTMDPGFIVSTQSDFVPFYKHLFGPQGHPLIGRSACYRMAAPVPLLTALIVAPGVVDKGEAMRALDLTWSVFIRRGALEAGAVTQGFCGTDLSVVPLYSGPASCLWSLRSLVVAFALDRELGLFDAQRAPLPVEKGDYRVTDPTTGWTIAGTRSSGRIELAIAANAESDDPALAPYGRLRWLLERLIHAPRRPDNTAALYRRRRYSTDQPIAACPRFSDSVER